MRLTKLPQCFDPDRYRVRESASGLSSPFEHEDERDDENELA